MYKEFYYDGDVEGQQKYHFDLNHGYETFDERLQRPLDEGLASICKYLLQKFSSTSSGITLREAVQYADFACFRGTLQKFAATFFETQRPKDRGWKFMIVKFQGVFFIQELETDARQEEKIKETAYEKLATYWGLKFERYILAENGKMPDSRSPVSTIVQTNAIFKLHFNPLPEIPKSITVFYSAEIDGISKEGKHMEVKTRNHRSVIHHRIMNWWLQCRLANIKKITFGMREDGIVKTLETCSIWKLENLHCRHPKRAYDFDIAMNSIHFFLHQIKSFYNNHLKMNEVLIIERKPMELNVQCSIQKANYSQIFSEDFLRFFGPKKRRY
uniref:Decapping nuclease n=1 Tax=Panagrolaimus superbus TaxID=310955 RepID=A0A914YQ51_9BILA